MRAPAYAQYVVAIGVCAQALAEQHDVPEVYTDYRAMIDSSELDALVVVTGGSAPSDGDGGRRGGPARVVREADGVHG